jgi:hypothetical protein
VEPLRGRLVGLRIREQVRKGGGKAEAATVPAMLVLPLPLVLGHRERGFLAALDHEADP